MGTRSVVDEVMAEVVSAAEVSFVGEVAVGADLASSGVGLGSGSAPVGAGAGTSAAATEVVVSDDGDAELGSFAGVSAALSIVTSGDADISDVVVAAIDSCEFSAGR